jgi:hypothetical protein
VSARCLCLVFFAFKRRLICACSNHLKNHPRVGFTVTPHSTPPPPPTRRNIGEILILQRRRINLQPCACLRQARGEQGVFRRDHRACGQGCLSPTGVPPHQRFLRLGKGNLKKSRPLPPKRGEARPRIFAFSCTVGFGRDGARRCFPLGGGRSNFLGLALAKS